MQIKMHYLYNEPSSSSPSPDLCWVFLRRATPGCGSRSRVSPPGRPHKFHKPSPAQIAPGKSTMALGHLTKGANWEELIQACLQSFGKSALTCFGTFNFAWWGIAVRSAGDVAASQRELFSNTRPSCGFARSLVLWTISLNSGTNDSFGCWKRHCVVFRP